jgi:hypothetical protein
MSESAPVDDPVGDALRNLVRDFGRLIGREPERVRSFIKDLLGERGWTYRRNAEAVVQAAEFGVPDILLSGQADSSSTPVRDRFRDNGFSADEADYGISAWASALSVAELPAALAPTRAGRPTSASQAATVLPGSDVTVVPPGAGAGPAAPGPAPQPSTELAGGGGPASHPPRAGADAAAAGAAGSGTGRPGGPDATIVPAHLTSSPTEPHDRQVRLGSAPKDGQPGGADPESGPHGPHGPRRKVILIAAAAVVVLVGGIVAAVALSGGDKGGGGKGAAAPANNTGVATVRGHADGLGTASIVRGSATLAVSKSTTLRVGDRVSAVTGPVQVDTGDSSVLRLDKGAQVLWSKAKPASSASSKSGSAGSGSPSASATPEEFQVVKGRVYAIVARGHMLVLHTTGTALTRVGPGRIVVACGTQCSYQALQENQQVQPRSGPALTLLAHQRVTVSAAGAASRQLILPDLIRGDPFIAANVKLDAKQRLSSAPIAGPSILGPWAIKVLWQNGTAAHRLIYRQLTFSVDCSTGQCVLKAVQTPAPMTCPPGTSCPMQDTVAAGEAQTTSDTDTFALNFGGRAADCSGDGRRDGTESTTADVRLTGNADGHRTTFQATYHTLFKASGPACGQSYLVPPDYDRAEGRPGTLLTSPLPQPGAEENLLNRNTRTQSPCARSTTRPAGSTAAISCQPAQGQRDPAKRPATMLLISFSNAASLRAAYNAQLSAMGGATNYGSCEGAQSCERPLAGTTGRLSILAHGGTTDLIAYAPEQSLVLLVAKGFRTPAAAYPWFATRMDADLPWLPIAHF